MSQPPQAPHTPRDDDDEKLRKDDTSEEEEDEEEEGEELPLPGHVEDFVQMAQRVSRRHASEATNILYGRRLIFLNTAEELRSCINVFLQCLGGLTSAIALVPYQELITAADRSLNPDIYVAMHQQIEAFHRLVELMRKVCQDIVAKEQRGHTRDNSIVEFSQPMGRAASAVGSDHKHQGQNQPRGFAQSKSLQRR